MPWRLIGKIALGGNIPSYKIVWSNGSPTKMVAGDLSASGRFAYLSQSLSRRLLDVCGHGWLTAQEFFGHYIDDFKKGLRGV
jgi:hypothetical protein